MHTAFHHLCADLMNMRRWGSLIAPFQAEMSPTASSPFRGCRTFGGSCSITYRAAATERKHSSFYVSARDPVRFSVAYEALPAPPLLPNQQFGCWSALGTQFLWLIASERCLSVLPTLSHRIWRWNEPEGSEQTNFKTFSFLALSLLGTRRERLFFSFHHTSHCFRVVTHVSGTLSAN